MGIYFGTDGLRGIYGESVSPEIAFKVGNSLGRLCQKYKRIVIGRDTRKSGSLLTLAFASGIMCQGVNVYDVCVAPTPTIAYLTKNGKYDFGVVISASHNDASFNGIKIFDSEGMKLSEKLEATIERKLLYSNEVEHESVGKYFSKPVLIQKYKRNILSNFPSLKGLKIVLDCANGATGNIAKELFSQLEAKVVALNVGRKGLDINENCGALYPSVISEAVKKHNADMGFSFDGDGDRIIACNEKGEILDGDDILYILSQAYPNETNIVGTSMTNSGLEQALKKQGKNLLRADVGDKYVVELMKSTHSRLGGETSGHIINFDYSTTGDGVLTALTISSLAKKSNLPLSKLANLVHFPQALINLAVVDKYSTLNSSILSSEILRIQREFGDNGRVLVRASGTENKIRIMCEHKSKQVAEQNAKHLETLISNQMFDDCH